MTSGDEGLTPLRIFLSSPGDVTAEREKARQVIDHLQFDPFVRGRATFDLVSWDDPHGSPPLAASATPQESINLGMPRPGECDVVIVILWGRMGTPLPYPDYQKSDGSHYLSGTDWEYEDALAASESFGAPIVLVYRRTTQVAIDPENPCAEEMIQQSRLVKEFFARMRDPESGAIRRGHKKYGSPEEFRSILDFDLRSLTHRLLDQTPVADTVDEADLPPLWEGSPFPGLRAFTPADEPIFFGRGRETDELVSRVTSNDFVAVVGSSGSGKSSLVGAGLLPRLSVERPQWRLPEYDARANRWTRLRCTPAERGRDPFIGLARQLALQGRSAELRENPVAVGQMLPEGISVLFIDQFEELFANVEPSLVKPFVTALTTLIATSRCKVVITLRADFYHRCLEDPELARMLELGQLPLTAPSDTLVEMVTRPAERAGLVFEEGLLGRILSETGRDPEALPLLAYTLDELYHADTSDKLLDVETYERLGGVRGAIGTRADVTFSRLDAETQEVFPLVFRELVTVDDAGRATRRLAHQSMIAGGPAARRLVAAFTEARLLVQSRDEANQPVVYVAHEALFGSWPRLAVWIASARDDLMLHRRVLAAALEWSERDHDAAYLWPHERLIEVYEMLTRSGLELDPVTASFVRPEYERIFPTLDDPDLEQHQRQYAMDRLVTIGPATVPGLLTLLRSGSSRGRESASAVLARLGDPAIDGLVAALDHPDTPVRLETVSALRMIGVPRVVSGLSKAVRDEDTQVRSAAIGALSAVGGDEARESLAIALQDSEADLRWQAAGLLGAFGPEAVPHLLSLPEEDEVSAETAQLALLAIGERGLPQLFDGLRTSEPGVRFRAAQVLAKIGVPAVPGLIDVMSDPNPDVRWSACDVLAACPAPPDLKGEMTEVLATVAGETDPRVRCAALNAFAHRQGEIPVDQVAEALADDDDVVRWAACDVLATNGASVTGKLVETMAAGSRGSRLASAALTRAAGVRELKPLIGRYAGWVEDRLEEALASAIESDHCDVLPLLDASENSVRDAAARTLARLGDPAGEGLVGYLGHDDPAVRKASAWALGVIATKSPEPSRMASALVHLERMLVDSDRDCRLQAADSMSCFGVAALPPLWRALRSRQDLLHESALRLTVGIGPLAVQGLLVLARDQSVLTSEKARTCLRAITVPSAVFGLAELATTSTPSQGSRPNGKPTPGPGPR